MLLSFSIENYRSFREETELSLLADQRVQDHPEQVASQKVPGDVAHGILRYGLIYGPNNSGKSNLIRALWHLSLVATREGNVELLSRQTNLYHQGTNRPLWIDTYFLNGGRVYHYGVSLLAGVVEAEWLSSVVEDREELIFDRSADGITWGELVLGDDPRFHGFLDYVGAGCPRNQLLLREATFRNVQAVEAASDWFRRVVLVSASFPDDILHERLSGDSALLEFVNDLMRRADTGIAQMHVDESVPAHGLFPRSTLRLVAIKSELGSNGRPLETSMDEHESDGTRRLPVLFVPLYLAKDGPPVYLIDEVERSLHTELTEFVLHQYLDTCIQHNGQMIVATHDTRLMAAEKIRRDGVWFMDLVPGHGTRLRSLSDFEPRKAIPREKRYLEGRFGGVPLLERHGYVPSHPQ